MTSLFRAPTEPGAGPGLHHPEFSPDDAMVGEVARALLGAVVAAGAALTDPGLPAPGAVTETVPPTLPPTPEDTEDTEDP